jgi:DNA gyrase/topoisomerase IV subunit A
MMMTWFLQEAFSRFGKESNAAFGEGGPYTADSDFLAHAIERVLDETLPRLRAVPGYRQRLEGPVTDAFLYIDELVEHIPDSFQCSRSAFSVDPRVKSFFVNPRHMQEVFSQSKDVRELFDAAPQAEECCALVCMRMEERQKFGVAQSGDRVHREVMQTSVSFTDHEVYTPGVSETDARRALKCCIFGGILKYTRGKLIETKTSDIERRKRLTMLRSRLRKVDHQAMLEKQQTDLQTQIQDLEDAIKQEARRPATLEDRLALVADTLRNANQFVSASFQHLHLSHMGIKVEQDSNVPAHELDIAEIQIATRGPRVAALVRFPRRELLPKTEFLLHADSLFLN